MSKCPNWCPAFTSPNTIHYQPREDHLCYYPLLQSIYSLHISIYIHFKNQRAGVQNPFYEVLFTLPTFAALATLFDGYRLCLCTYKYGRYIRSVQHGLGPRIRCSELE